MRKLFFSAITLLCFLLASGVGNAQVPTISSFTPQTGPIGTKVTINGTNFSSTPAQNIVYFGTVRAIVGAASPTSLTVYVPIGTSYNPILVTVNLLTAASPAPFIVTKTGSQNLTATSFATHADVASAGVPYKLSVSDYDANGIVDLSMGTDAGGFINFSAFRNTADCSTLSFASEQTYYSGSANPKTGIASADLDGNGLQDVVISETTSKFVTVHQNLSYPGALSFQNQSPLASAAFTVGDVKIADMDGDGKMDIVTGLFNGLGPTSGVAIYRNTSPAAGTLTFAAPQTLTFLANPQGIELSDIDGDGMVDIIITDGLSSVRIRRNKSTAGTIDNTTFDAEAIVPTAAGPIDVRAGDIDGDGKTDLAVACGSAISLLRNVATAGSITSASFSSMINFTGVSPTSIDLADLNGDGKIDVAVANGSNVTVFQNQATSGSISGSSLGSALNLSIGTATVNQIKLSDLNGDGYIDIAATQSGKFFSVFLFNPPPSPTPTITSFSPASGIVNSNVTITGTNFGTSVSTNAVWFGATKATITNASASQLNVTVPLHATFGPITVENLSENRSAISLANFDPVFNNNKDFGGRIIPSSLAAKAEINIGTSNAGYINLADIDGDGYSEILVSATSNDSLIILRNKGNKIPGPGGFEKTGLYFDTDGNGTVLGRDMDGDGKLDLVMMVRGSGDQDEILIYHNEGAPGSISPASFAPAFQVHLPFLHINNTELVITDIDGDGKQDLVCQNSGAISIFRNNSLPGSYCFAPSVDLAGAGGQAISVGDLDGDEKPDLVVARGYYGLPGFNVVRNTSTPGLISFSTPVVFAAAGSNLVDVEVADLDSDGKPEIAWVSPSATSMALHVMKNTATSGSLDASSFAAEVDYAWNAGNYSPYSHTRIADINGDGKPDVISCENYLGIFENSSTAGIIDVNSFHHGVAFNVPFNYSVQYPAIGDLDGDGKPEVVTQVSSYSSNVIYIFRNENYPAPRIDLLKNSTATTQSAPIGAQIITHGDYQNTNNDAPVLYFGAIKATTNSITNSDVSTNVPPGSTAERVSATLHGLTGFSPQPFNSTFVTTGVLDATTFASGIDFPLTTGATPALVAGDFDNDGKPDIASGDGGQVAILKNNLSAGGTDISSSTLTQQSPNISAGLGLDPIMVSDIDGDGLLDIFGNTQGYRNNSGTQSLPISFEAGVNIVPGAFPGSGRSKTNIDFNHDGKTDIVMAYSSNSVFVCENLSVKGAFYGYVPFSTFDQTVIFNVTGTLGEASAGDFDGDGYDDIVVLNNSANQLVTLLNSGGNREITSASFATPQTVATGASPYYVYVADLNMDGKLDVIVGYKTIATVTVFQNTSTTGTISFTRQDFASLSNIYSLNAADLDGDGKQEIVTIHGNGSTGFNFSILKNTSTSAISFGSKIDYALADQPQGLFLADINLDGQTDILVSHNKTLTIYQNKLHSTPTIAILPQPTDVTVCAGKTASLSVSASGTTNITYQWQFSATKMGTYTDLAEGGGYSNVTTANLQINTSGNFGAGFYSVRVNGDLAAQVISNNAQVTINPVPSSPTATGATTCKGGTGTLIASGGTDGNYKWYTSSTATDAIVDAVNGAYTTPSLTTTTTYFVSLTSTSSCESDRTLVTATVLSTACTGTAPVIKAQPLAVQAGDTVTLNLIPLITTSGTLDVSSIHVVTQPNSGAIAIVTNGVLSVNYKNDAFIGTESVVIVACDQNGLCSQQTFEIDVTAKLIIYNGVSPNADGANDFFNLKNIELSPKTQNNTVKIYNRWGDEVFSVINYDNAANVFVGRGKSGNKLPSGIYFYKIELPDYGKTLTGYLSLKE